LNQNAAPRPDFDLPEPSMQMRARSLAEALEASPDLASVFRDLERARRVVRLLADAVKPAGIELLAPSACNWRSSQLTLSVASTSQAAKLRQLLPTLETRLHNNGFEGIQIRVRVQPDAIAYPIGGQSATTSISPSGSPGEGGELRVPTEAELRFAEKLAQTDIEGPLKTAAQRLRTLLAGRLTKSRHGS
jgi:hypothetical protein